MAEALKKSSLLRAALEALAQGNHAEAVRCCKHALKQDRSNYDAFVILGKSLFGSKQYDQADIAYKRATDMNPTDPRAWQGLAELHESTGNFERVVEACTAVIKVFESKGDLVHHADYARKLAKAHVALSDHKKALEAWRMVLEKNQCVSEALHLEALCGTVEAMAELMQVCIQENCKRFLQEKNLEESSARHLAENEWASSQDGLDFERLLRDALKQIHNNEKYETMLLQLLVWRLRASSSSKGNEWHQLCLQVLHLCLYTLAWHASSLATVVLLAICEEDNMDDIFSQMGMAELAQGRENRFKYLGKRLVHVYPDQALVIPIIAFFIHQSTSLSLGQKRLLCESALRMNENSLVGWQVLAEVRASEGSHSSAAECVRRGLQVIDRFRVLYGLTLQCAELRLQVLLADVFLRSGQQEESLKVLESVIEISEGNQDVELCKVLAAAKEGQVKLFLAEGRTQEASATLVSLLGLDKSNSWALSEQGWLAYQQKDYEQATMLLQKAVDLKPSDAGYRYRLGIALWASASGKEKALSHLLESAKLDPGHMEVFRILGHYYKEVPGGSTRAVRCYQRAISINCEDDEAGEALCDLLDSGGQESLELVSCQEACQKSPRCFWAFRRLGYLQVRKKEWAKAAKNLQHAVRGYPMCADVWEALGVAYQQLGMLTAALKAYGRALTISADGSLYALQQSGNILLTLGHFRKAVAMFQAAIAKAPDHPATLFGMASALFGQANECRSMGAIRWSAALLQEASSEASCFIKKYGNIGSTWKLLGDIEISYARNLPWEPASEGALDERIEDESRVSQENKKAFTLSVNAWKERCLGAAFSAKRAYQNALHLQPHKGNSYSDLCLCLHSIGALTEDDQSLSSKSDVMEALAYGGLALEPSNADLWTSLGVVSRIMGVKQHAFIQAIFADGNHALAWAELGLLYLKEGEHKLAEEAFMHARSADATLALTWAAMASMHATKTFDQMEEASASILYAAQLYPIANFQLGLAKIAAATNQLGSAQVYAAVQQAVLQAPHCPESHNFKGLVCELHGENESAVAAFKLSRAALDLGRVNLKSGTFNSKRHAVSMNLARALCKAGDAHEAVKEYETLAKSGNLEDSGALRGYATALWQAGQKKLGVSIAKVALKKASGKPEMSAIKQLLAKFVYYLSGYAVALEDPCVAVLDCHTEAGPAITAFAIGAAAGQCDFLLRKMSEWAVLFDHDNAAELADLLAASLQFFQEPSEKAQHANAVHLLQKSLHMHPQSLLLRTKLMKMLLQRTNGAEVKVAAKCCSLSMTSSLEKADDIGRLCQVLGGAAACCRMCGNIKPQFSFSSCKSYNNESSHTIQVLQHWMHLEPWNIMSAYHLVLALMQLAREQKYPVSMCGVLQRMIGTILGRLSAADDPANGEVHQYMRMQLLLCGSETALHSQETERALESARVATGIQLPQKFLPLPCLQLLRCHAVTENTALVDTELKKIKALGPLDLPTLLCAFEMSCGFRQDDSAVFTLTDLDMTAYGGGSSYEHIPKALLEWKKAETYIRRGQLSMAEAAMSNATAFWPEAVCLHLLHGAISMELGRNGSGSINLSVACRRLMKANELPIAALLLAQAQPEKAGLPGWERLVRAEWALWPKESKPAELYFQMGVLGKMSKANTSEAGKGPASASPRVWFKRAVHTNPSCARYWKMLLEQRQLDDDHQESMPYILDQN